MPLPPSAARTLAGIWRLHTNEPGCCYGLDVQPDAARGPGYFARLVHWKSGRLGCDTRSSDLGWVELTEKHPAGGDNLVLGGRVPRTIPDRWVDVELIFPVLVRSGGSGVLIREGESVSVRLEPSDFFPPFDAREPS
jgi:hypothetical protein